jgi:hypothetical protein
MNNLRGVSIVLGLAAMLAAGCGDTGPKPAARKAVRNAPPPPPPAQFQPAPPQPHPEPVRKKAEVGAGAKQGGLYPVATYWRIREQIDFIQVEKAMQLYKAEHDNKGPKTTEEFMEKIIKANQIHLPVLFANERYVYDPQREELMIEVLPQ